MKLILLTKGDIAVVDDADFALVSGFSWYSAHGYAQRSQMFGSRTDGTRYVRTYRMHQMIMPPKAGMEVDHENGNGFDNRRENLRYATHSQNIANIGVSPRNALGVKGVSMHGRKYRARIRVRGRLIQIGLFASAGDAHAAYSEAAQKYFGRFARAI